MINDDPPAPGRSADDDAELDAEDALLGVIGVDELGGVILGAPRRRSPAHEAYWREQAIELERALEATGDKSTRVFVGAGGRLHLYDPAEEGVSDSPSSDVFANAIETAPAPPTSDATSERPSAEDSRTAPKTSGASSEEEASCRSGADDASLSASRFFASVATLGLPALANSCVEPLLSSAETACAAKMGVLYLAALAPSTSLFAFAAEMCFAVSVVVTTAVAKAGAAAAAEKRSAFAAAETSSSSSSSAAAARVAVASMSAAFGGGALLAAVFAIAAAPILSLMHVPPEAHATVRTYVAIRALGLPFFAAANAAEGAFVGDGDGATPMRAWVAGGAASLAALVLASHPSALGLGLPGAACAIAGGQALTLLLFWREMRRKGWFDQRGAGGAPSEGDETNATKKTRGAAAAFSSSSSSSSSSLSLAGHARDLARVLSDSNVVRDIGWMFLGAVSRMGTYAAVTTAASALGVIPGATHKVALETFWLLSFFTEPVFTASNALLPREMGCAGSEGRSEGIGGVRAEERDGFGASERDGFGASEGIGRHSSPSPRARKLRDAFVACSVALGAALALAASRMTATAAYSDDPAVSALLATLSTPVALTVGLSAIAYGVEGTLIGAGRVGYLGRTHARDFFVVLAALKARELGGGFGGGLRGARRGVVDLGGVPGLADSATLGALTTREAVRAAGEGRGVGGGAEVDARARVTSFTRAILAEGIKFEAHPLLRRAQTTV